MIQDGATKTINPSSRSFLWSSIAQGDNKIRCFFRKATKLNNYEEN